MSLDTNHNFVIGEKVVYPAHGVGEIMTIENQTISDMHLEVYVVLFKEDKMTLRVPVKRAKLSGLRHLVDIDEINEVYKILQQKPKRGNKMWSRRAQEYEGKINSGSIFSIAEVVRDLYKNVDQDRSYSERSIYEVAVRRLASEISILEKMEQINIETKIHTVLRDKVAA